MIHYIEEFLILNWLTWKKIQKNYQILNENWLKTSAS